MLSLPSSPSRSSWPKPPTIVSLPGPPVARVVARAAVDQVVVAPAEQLVRPRLAEEAVRARRRRGSCRPPAARDLVSRAPLRHDAIGARACRAGGRPGVDRHASAAATAQAVTVLRESSRYLPGEGPQSRWRREESHPRQAIPVAMEAKRTLVESPPELWAEVSDVAALARHLGEFGEIRITRTEPEAVVEWEGDRASGSVRLEPSGWGTKVMLTAEVPEPGRRPGARRRRAAAAAPVRAAVVVAARRRRPSRRAGAGAGRSEPPRAWMGARRRDSQRRARHPRLRPSPPVLALTGRARREVAARRTAAPAAKWPRRGQPRRPRSSHLGVSQHGRG